MHQRSQLLIYWLLTVLIKQLLVPLGNKWNQTSKEYANSSVLFQLDFRVDPEYKQAPPVENRNFLTLMFRGKCLKAYCVCKLERLSKEGTTGAFHVIQIFIHSVLMWSAENFLGHHTQHVLWLSPCSQNSDLVSHFCIDGKKTTGSDFFPHSLTLCPYWWWDFHKLVSTENPVFGHVSTSH